MSTYGLLFVLVVTFNIHLSTTKNKGLLCTSHSTNATSDLCQEFMRMRKQRIITCNKPTSKFSCKGRCNVTNERKNNKECFCDPECSLLGDCCVDYYDWCNKNPFSNTQAKFKCFTSEKLKQAYVVVSECANSWKDTAVEKMCKSENSTDPLIHIPVYDYGTSLTFANVFCALCNGASNYSYWNVRVLTTSKNVSLSHVLNKTINWTVEPNPPKSAQFCIPSPTLKSATKKFSNTINRTLLWSYCKSYSLPLNKSCSDKVKNPHCDMLFNKVAAKYSCELKCITYITYTDNTAHVGIAVNTLVPQLAPFSLIFSFQNKIASPSSQNQFSDHVVIIFFCQRGEIYDPFLNRCRRLFQLPPDSSVNMTNETFVNGSLCLGREHNQTEELLCNNSVIMDKSQLRCHSLRTGNGTYYICVDIKPPLSYSSQPLEEVSSLMTLIGLLISITALLLFLLSRALFSELRTFFGKNLICLAVSLLLFQITFLLAGQTEIPAVCNVITALLHFSVLSVFSWMSVMAFGLCRTFSSEASISSGEDDNITNRRRLILYSLYAWGIPLVIMITCSVLALTRTVDTGYHGYGGKTQFCYLSTTGRIYCTAVPIAAALLFNFVALTRTLYSIRKVQKGTQRVVTNSLQPSLVRLGLKLTSVVGLSWILGFVYAIAPNPYVEYLFIVMNSLQGVFIFVSFGCNKRIFALYKNLCCRKRVNKISDVEG